MPQQDGFDQGGAEKSVVCRCQPFIHIPFYFWGKFHIRIVVNWFPTSYQKTKTNFPLLRMNEKSGPVLNSYVFLYKDPDQDQLIKHIQDMF